MDSYYTPSDLAAKLISKATRKKPYVYIADFAAGNGDLLKAAHKKWPKARFIATDINRKATHELRRSNPKWLVSKVDFLNGRARARSKTLTRVKGKVSLIVLNPPFSCRGAERWSVSLNGKAIRCSLAMAFLLNSLNFLSSNGQILAILPSGSLQSQKDAAAWDLLRRMCNYKIVGENGHASFPGCHARTMIVRFALRKNAVREVARDSENSIQPIRNGGLVKIIRGSVQMHTLNGHSSGVIPLIHSTELFGDVDLLARNIRKGQKTFTGPAVLLPRVGKPIKEKICVYLQKRPIVLSDCVLGVKCSTSSTAKSLRRTLVGSWRHLKQKYGGTCAPYITVTALKDLLARYGLRVPDQQKKKSLASLPKAFSATRSGRKLLN